MILTFSMTDSVTLFYSYLLCAFITWEYLGSLFSSLCRESLMLIEMLKDIHHGNA